jgi:DNA-binding NarL/FixJ family response regulator
VLKTDTGRDLVKAVEAVSEHQTFFTAKIADMVVDGYLRANQAESPPKNKTGGLTPREREVLQLLAEGRTNKEVAVALGIATKTAEAHRVNIMRKLKLHSVAELVRYAVRNRMLSA